MIPAALSKYLGAGLMFGATVSAISQLGLRSSPFGRRILGNPEQDMSALSGSTTPMRLARSTFGGENLMMNLAAAVGGYMGATALEKRHGTRIFQSRGRRELRAWGRMSGQAWTGAEIAGDLPKPQTYTRQQARNIYAKHMEINKSMSPVQRGRMLGANKSQLKGLAGAGRLRRVASLAAWAPMAFMAFDMVGSLSSMPAPTFESLPRKSATLSGTFMDTGMAATQRRRALEAMHNSQYAGRSALGNEGALAHS